MKHTEDLQKDFNRLSTAINELLYFNLIHESSLVATEEEMAEKYPMETLQWNQENNPEYEEYLETPPLDFIFEQADDQAACMENLREAIKTHIFRY
jgi:hypothetical protein